MSRIYLSLATCLLLTLNTLAQRPATTADSASIYADSLHRMSNRALSEMQGSDEYLKVKEAYQRLALQSDDYVSVNLFTEVFASNLSIFNAGLAQAGFRPLNEESWRLGIGQTFKRRRFVFDFTWVSAGINQRRTQGNQRLDYRSSSVAALDFGYDLVRQTKVNIYPFAGVRLHTAVLGYVRDNGYNGNAPSVAQLLPPGTAELTMTSVRFGLQAGLGLDLVLSQNERGGGIMLFGKAGVAPTIGKERFRGQSIRYQTDNQPGLWAAQIGVKFFRRGTRN